MSYLFVSRRFTPCHISSFLEDSPPCHISSFLEDSPHVISLRFTLCHISSFLEDSRGTERSSTPTPRHRGVGRISDDQEQRKELIEALRSEIDSQLKHMGPIIDISDHDNHNNHNNNNHNHNNNNNPRDHGYHSRYSTDNNALPNLSPTKSSPVHENISPIRGIPIVGSPRPQSPRPQSPTVPLTGGLGRNLDDDWLERSYEVISMQPPDQRSPAARISTSPPKYRRTLSPMSRDSSYHVVKSPAQSPERSGYEGPGTGVLYRPNDDVVKAIIESVNTKYSRLTCK